ncbi:P-loop containing nucleoside triphosphate hydrolase protein [Choiromyces venosus 120613-1]|uniref:P-loop containing nucleoside triphosphate hydrolase protein n=1 Tax=Choiromyces venosus 120613-1 TaxID=1336337 RepID=A0A3N4JRZ5_9PEZI|nr:P-loop containing nucleoside triphosphate hydrolase protein [Choiromyces venosus 120613-1]
MVKPRKKSKRVPVRLRHKIEKRSNEKARKERKDAKKHPELHRKKKNDKLNIPNSFPYKDRLLSEIEEGRRLKEEEQLRRRELAKQRKKELAAEAEDEEDAMQILEGGEDSSESDSDAMDEDDDAPTGGSAMAALLASARARAAEYEAEHGDSSGESDDDSDSEIGIPDLESKSTRRDTSRKAFDKMFKQVIDAADVILYVLDARDPEATRSRDVERQIMAADGGEKRLILILNKIDLVPATVLKGWLDYLRRYFPTLPLRASGSAANAQTFDHKSLTVQGTSAALLKALKSFAHAKQLKRSVSVGVIGYPNVGKSSVINALTGRLGGSQTACPTGAEAGVTTSLREVKLDKKLKLLDSPGIVFPGSDSQGGSKDDQARLILLNAVPPKQILDPVPAVALLIRRLSTSQTLFNKLLDVYNLPPLVDTTVTDITTDFLVQVARKRGRLGKGGIPNIEAAAKAVIMDWRDGRIQGWVDPPAAVPNNTNQGVKPTTAAITTDDQKEIVKEWAEEFKLDGLWGEDWNEGGQGEEMEMQE